MTIPAIDCNVFGFGPPELIVASVIAMLLFGRTVQGPFDQSPRRRRIESYEHPEAERRVQELEPVFRAIGIVWAILSVIGIVAYLFR